MRNTCEHPVTTGELLDYVIEGYVDFLKRCGQDTELDMIEGEFLTEIIRRLVPPDGCLTPRKYFVTGIGQILSQVHAADRCAGEDCVIHSPSQHSMRQFRTLYRGDRPLMERLCPHGVGHPDPDDLAHKARQPNASKYEGVHGCDGCCS